MKNALILHGAGNNHEGNWFPWLKIELENKGYEVSVPDLPNSDTPILKDWLTAVKDFDCNPESLLVGHSSGATLILRILENLPADKKVFKSILVAGFVEKDPEKKYFPWNKDLLETPFNWEKIKDSCLNFDFICSDNDPYDCGEEQGKIMQEKLGGNLIVEKEQGHFNLELSDYYHSFPLLLTLV
ncbi:MAG: RBBP9/YdeN family alpha/beta hydrolase [Candidatus Levyibacteriota bacterium]